MVGEPPKIRRRKKEVWLSGDEGILHHPHFGDIKIFCYKITADKAVVEDEWGIRYILPASETSLSSITHRREENR